MEGGPRQQRRAAQGFFLRRPSLSHSPPKSFSPGQNQRGSNSRSAGARWPPAARVVYFAVPAKHPMPVVSVAWLVPHFRGENRTWKPLAKRIRFCRPPETRLKGNAVMLQRLLQIFGARPGDASQNIANFHLARADDHRYAGLSTSARSLLPQKCGNH